MNKAKLDCLHAYYQQDLRSKWEAVDFMLLDILLVRFGKVMKELADAGLISKEDLLANRSSEWNMREANVKFRIQCQDAKFRILWKKLIEEKEATESQLSKQEHPVNEFH